VLEVGAHYPRTRGLPPDHRHAVHVDEVDLLVASDQPPFPLPDPPITEVDRAIAEHATRLIPDGATLQTGIGAVPSMIATLLAEGDGGDYGIHSEMFTTGLMRLHQSDEEVAFLPVDVVNSPLFIRRNRLPTTINAALAIDVHGQVVADTIEGVQYSGVGGHEDFVSGPALGLHSRSLLCMRSTVTVAGEGFEPGTVITTPRHQVDTIVTEYGFADLQGKTVRQRGEALAAVAHPDFRDDLLDAAARASGGRSTLPPD
jgi:acyl-CoA hydrolase